MPIKWLLWLNDYTLLRRLDAAGLLAFFGFFLHGMLLAGIFVVPNAGFLDLSSRLLAQSQLASMQSVMFFRVVTLWGAQKVSEKLDFNRRLETTDDGQCHLVDGVEKYTQTFRVFNLFSTYITASTEHWLFTTLVTATSGIQVLVTFGQHFRSSLCTLKPVETQIHTQRDLSLTFLSTVMG